MPDATYCPTPDELRRFLTGELDDVLGDRVESHLAYCRACLETLHQLPTDDVLLAAVRVQAHRGPDPDREAIYGLMDRLRGLHPLRAAPLPAQESPAESALAAEFQVRRGQYSIVRPHAQGGLGSVSIARDERLKRQVALKEIHPDRAHEAELRGRFLNEAEIAGQLEHPGIIPIYVLDDDAAGRPYFAMRFIHGRTLTEAIREHHAQPTPRALRELLQRFVAVCQTIAYAHNKGVIHRDLKPANIMLGDYGETLVVDWGLAKRLKSSLSSNQPGRMPAGAENCPTDTLADAGELGLTEVGQVLGTPGYMSPEQASRPSDVGPAADIYALGAILYEILTAKAPFHDAGSPAEILNQLAAATPLRRPSQVQPRVDRALDAVCLRALSHHAKDRFRTAQDLASEIEKWLADEPVSCYCEPWTVRLTRWSRRHRHSVQAATAVVVLAAVVSTAAAILINQEKNEKARLARLAEGNRIQADERGRKAQREWERAEHQLYLSQMAGAQRAWESGDARAAWQYLNVSRAELRGWEYDYLYTLFSQNDRTLREHASGVNAVAFSPNRNHFVSAGQDSALRIWDRATRRVQWNLAGQSAAVLCVAYSPDGERIVSGSADGSLTVWNATTGELQMTLSGHTAAVTSVAFSGDGQQLASGSDDQTMRLWDGVSGESRHVFQVNTGRLKGLAFHPRGNWIVTASTDETLVLWNTVTHGRVDTPYSHGAILCVAFSPDGKQIATGGWDRTIKLWTMPENPDQLVSFKLFHRLAMARNLVSAARILRGHQGRVQSLSFSPDGQQIASGSGDMMVKLWDVATGDPLRTLQGHTDPVVGVAFSPDGNQIASASETIKLWSPTEVLGPPTHSGHIAMVNSVAVSPNGKQIAAATGRNVKLWDAIRRHGVPNSMLDLAFLEHSDRVVAVAFSPDGERYCSGSWDKTLKVWNASTGLRELTLVGHTDRVTGLAFSPDGKRIASSCYDKTVKLWDSRAGEILRTFEGHADAVSGAVFLPDGQRIVSASHDLTLKLWDVSSRQATMTYHHDSPVDCLAVSVDGKYLVSGAQDHTVKLWDVGTGECLRTMTGHSAPVTCVAFTRDGQRIVSGSMDLTLKLWDFATGHITLSLPAHTAPVTSLAFAPEGNWFVTGGVDQTIKFWDASAASNPGGSAFPPDVPEDCPE